MARAEPSPPALQENRGQEGVVVGVHQGQVAVAAPHLEQVQQVLPLLRSLLLPSYLLPAQSQLLQGSRVQEEVVFPEGHGLYLL